MKAKAKYTPILNGEYEVIGVKPGPVGTRFGVVDLSRVTEEMAARLVKAKSSYIRKSRPKTQEAARTDNAPRETKSDR